MLWTPPSSHQSTSWEPRLSSGVYLPAKKQRYDKPVGVDLFAGAGGFSLGFEQAGFQVAAALEFDYYAALTYMTNLARWGHLQIHFDTPDREAGFETILNKAMKDGSKVGASLPLAGTGWIATQPASIRGCEHFFIADAKNVTGKQILDALGLERGEVDCVFGGPPCQGFSIGGQRNVVDPRNSLVFEFARLILEIQPKTMVMENVPGIVTMTTPEGIPVIDALCHVLADGGFSSYNALRTSLLSTAGLGGAVKGGRSSNRKALRGELDEGLDLESLEIETAQGVLL